jgi:CRP/FNR family transcriptional regulator, anaerobic regulatory protein
MSNHVNCYYCRCRTDCNLATLVDHKPFCAEQLVLKKNTIIYSVGLPADSVFVVQSGSVSITHVNAGGQSRIAKFLGRGAIFGLDAFLTRKTRLFTAVTREESVLCLLSCTEFERLVKQDCERMWRLFLLVDNQIHDGEIEKLEISGSRLNKRLRRAVARITGGHTCGVPGQIKQRELAEFLGVSEETISRELKKSRRAGLIRTKSSNCA